jgi:biopolymer transport protein ExbD
MQFRRQRGEEVHVNLTPLIDVVFLLLIFFMVSTTFQKESHISLNLPEADGEAAVAAEKLQIEIVISAQGEYAVNNQALANKKIDTLRRAIKDMAAGKSDLPVIISADATAPHQSVITAMEAAGQLGFNRLSITTRKRTDS